MREVFFHHEPYRSMSPEEIGMRIDVPTALGKAQWWRLPPDSKSIVFTWARPGRQENVLKLISGEMPDYDFWEDYDEKARLWIVDMAAEPGVSGTQVGRFLGWALKEMGIAKEGELVLFRRNGGARPGRFGKAIVRG